MRITFCCPFVPMEWIAAHGIEANRIIPELSDRASIFELEGLCPYVRCFLSDVLSDAEARPVLFTTTCDQMRRAPEILRMLSSEIPVALMHVPTTWESPESYRLYRAEVERLGHFLVNLGGCHPSREELAAVMMDYDRRRAALRNSAGCLPAGDYARMLVEFGDPARVATTVRKSGKKIPIALLGGPLRRKDEAILDYLEGLGTSIVLNGTTNGEGTLPSAFDWRRVREDPFGVLTESYFHGIADAFRRPNTLLYQWLQSEMRTRRVAGLVFRHYPWCDTWKAEAHRLKEWAEVPVLILEASDEPGLDSSTKSRLEAFLEVLSP